MKAETVDLFDHVDDLPDIIKDILDSFSEGEQTYETCANLVKALNEVGYTCDYGLDANPHSLIKL